MLVQSRLILMFSILQRKSLCSISKLVLSFYISRQENGKTRFKLKNTISVLLVELKGFDGLGQFFAVFNFSLGKSDT